MAKIRKRRRFPIILTVMLLLFAAVYFGGKVLFPIQYEAIIWSESQKYQVDPYLVTAMIHTESRFQPDACSAKNAQGLMQITEPTWNWAVKKMGLEGSGVNPFEPRDNMEVGVWYLHYLKDTFMAHDETIVLAAYNAGEGKVRKWLADPAYSKDGVTLEIVPYLETERYIERIERAKIIYEILYPNVFDALKE